MNVASASYKLLLQVHFDVTYRTLDVVSTRSARLLGGNRSVAEVQKSSACFSAAMCSLILRRGSLQL